MVCRWEDTTPDFVDREHDKALFGRGGGDADGDFPLAGDGQLRELAGLVGEFLFVAGIQEHELEGFEVLVFGLDRDGVDADRIGQIWILHG